jgi:hypothetical protein
MMLPGLVRYTILAAVLAFHCQGCVQGERFGEEGFADDDSVGTDLDTDADSDIDIDTGEVDPFECNVEAAMHADSELVFALDAVDGDIDHTWPLNQGKVIQLSVRDPRRIRVLPAKSVIGEKEKIEDGLMFVLLRDCANAATNRLAWGADIYSETLTSGDYYLAVFADEERSVDFQVHFLEPTECDDADQIELDGSEVAGAEGATAGYADDFEGSCQPELDEGHHGDRVYYFNVPIGELWDVSIDLFTGDLDGPEHYVYLRKNCSGPEHLELDCAAEFNGPVSQEQRVRVRGDDLVPGQYYVVVDTVAAEQFDDGEFGLELSFQAQSQY